MKTEDDITHLYRNGLSDAEMDVRDGFWQALQADLDKAEGRAVPLRRRWLPRVAAAASIALVLAGASAAFWCLSQRPDVKEAMAPVASIVPVPEVRGDHVQASFPPPAVTPPVVPGQTVAYRAAAPTAAGGEEAEDGQVSVRLSITITENGYVRHPQSAGGYRQASHGRQAVAQTSKEEVPTETPSHSPAEAPPSNWAFKAGIGTALPKGDYAAPLVATVGIERRLGKRWSLEAGLQYTRLGGAQVLHTIGIPVRANVLLAENDKVDFYAMAGGMAEKTVAGAADNSFRAEPVGLSVMAGVGVRYKLNRRLALFAEPAVTHRFATASETETLHSERPTNLQLLCGMRMLF